MKTWQDLEKIAESDRGSFCITAVNAFRSTSDYSTAVTADKYYRKHNPTIENFQKFLYTMSGARKKDIYSANYKIKSNWFRNLVVQQVSYVLSNGISFNEEDTKEKLGNDFAIKIQTLAKKALVHGRAFAFWNVDHLEVFGYADTKDEAGFCPLYDEDTGRLKGGIRFWEKGEENARVQRYTLFEPDGYTEYSKPYREDISELSPKRAYVLKIGSTADGGQEYVLEENYSDIPIIQMFASDTKESEIVGIKESVDCYDLIKSGLMNMIDDTPELYWILKNTGGMDDPELAKFVQRITTVHAAVVDGDSDVAVDSHTISLPTDARHRALELLRSDIYEDFGSLDVKSLSASQKTTQEIQAAYQKMDDKCGDFEGEITKVILQLLSLLGIDDAPSYTWNKVVNKQEQVNMLLSVAQYIPEEMLLKKLPIFTPDEVEEILDNMDEEGYDQMTEEESMEEPTEDFDQEGATSEIESILENLMAQIEEL